MKRLGFLILLLAGCNHQDDVNTCVDKILLNEPPCQIFIDVTTPCIIHEVIEKVNGNELNKYVYYHDGLNYDRIDIYGKRAWEDEYPEQPSEIITLNYVNNKITEVTAQPSATPNIYRKTNFEYSDVSVTINFELIEDGVVTFAVSGDQLFLLNPKDSSYISSGFFDILREYKSGNNTRFAVEADTGKCIINDQRWVFTVKTSFDLNPNVFSDYAVRFPLGKETGYAGQFWFGNNRNNIVATVNPYMENIVRVNCYTFLRNGNQIWIKEYEINGAQEYHYSYKYSCE